MFKEDFRSIRKALRELSPVVVDVAPAIRRVLMRRYAQTSLENARIAPLPFLLLALSVGYEAPLAPRLVIWSALVMLCVIRELRGRRLLRLMDGETVPSDRLHDLLVIVGSAFWGFVPLLMLLYGRASETNLFVAVFVGFSAIALTSIGYLSALPACCSIVGVSTAPVIVCLALYGTHQGAALACGVLMGAVMLMQRISAAHGILLGALAAEAQNAVLVQELETYRRALERENASLGTSLRDASHAASRDALTNLYNRRYLAAFAEPLVEAVREHREEVTVCIVDVDHFKRVNDAHGHPVGDEVLRFIAVLLGSRLRDFDCLARYGGEEFAIILRRCDVARGRRVAEALRHNVACAEIDTDIGTVVVTISIGVAQWAAGERLDEVVHRADRALYRAKQTGRDRVEIDSNDVLRSLAVSDNSTFPANLH